MYYIYILIIINIKIEINELKQETLVHLLRINTNRYLEEMEREREGEREGALSDVTPSYLNR